MLEKRKIYLFYQDLSFQTIFSSGILIGKDGSIGEYSHSLYDQAAIITKFPENILIYEDRFFDFWDELL